MVEGLKVIHTPTRIWHLSSNRWHSAAAEYAMSLHRALSGTKSYESYITVKAGTPSDCILSAEFGDSVVSTLESFGLSRFKTLKAIGDSIKPQIIVTYGGSECLLTKYMFPNAKHVRVFTEDRNKNKRLKGIRNRFALSHVDTIVCPSLFLKSKLRKRASKLQKPRIHFLRLGRSEEKYYSQGLWDAGKVFPLSIVGRLDAVKGHKKSFEVYYEFCKKFQTEKPLQPVPKLQIIGKNSFFSADQLREQAHEIGVNLENIIWINEKVDNIESYMEKSSVGWIPSLGSELICRVAEEFLMCGTPVFVSNAGSLFESLCFKSSGDGYFSDKPAKKIAEQLFKLYETTRNEGLNLRSKRAEKSAGFFGLVEMRNQFIDIIS